MFLSNSLRFPKQHCLLVNSQSSPVCPSGKSIMWIEISTENVTDRGKRKYS